MSYNPNNPNGSATSANSAPVVIASDQSAIPSNLNDGLGTAINSLSAGTGQNGILTGIGPTSFTPSACSTTAQLAVNATYTSPIE